MLKVTYVGERDLGATLSPIIYYFVSKTCHAGLLNTANTIYTWIQTVGTK